MNSHSDSERPGAARILVADDYRPNQLLIEAALKSGGYSCRIVGDGLQVLRACEEEAFALVLMDLRMPDIDGMEAARRLRASNGPNRNVPIIAITADDRDDSEEQRRAVGIDQVLYKPIQRHALLAALRGRLQNNPVKAPGNGKPGAPDDDNAPTLDFDGAVREFGGIRSLTLSAARQVARVGARQLEIIRGALAENNFEKIREEAHKLRGATGHLKAAPTMKAAEAVENLARDRDGTKLAPAVSRLENAFNALSQAIATLN